MPGAKTAPAIDPADDLALLREVVAEAGTIALTYFRADPKTWTKGKDDPVSEADIAIDNHLRQRLTDARPTYGWLSEETEDSPDRLSCRQVWIVDPIDGTRAFIEGRAEFTIAAASVEDGRPTAGVVFNPATDEFFDAVAGGGAWLNGDPIAVTQRAEFDGTKMLASSRLLRREIDRVTTTPASFDIVNSIAYRLALVAAGRYDGTVALGSKSDWDLAAADLILAEAGGILSDTDGQTFTYNSREARHSSLIGAGPALHAALIDVIGGIDW